MLTFSLIKISELIPSEQISEEYADNLCEEISKSKVWKFPILIDINTNIILDGHHRFAVAKKLRFKYIPCILVEFNSSIISVTSWRTGKEFCKNKILNNALSGNLFEYKTTKNTLHANVGLRSEISLDILQI
ncbi:hypothetical protein fh0823_11950 [Francisella halioticida]|uniref:ParB-like N-terminal domain-containing protein n=1 Tax=Francisella halioticida TaxID=549298 RepID=A0ABM6M048_9GAMM|nr:ParB N-terminal domain-containing protein [Francisella halioticida]ASG68241.1 hypothetical protein CDV26_07420 [Francisella halioticida]BCD91056.1 hypothetical protein fh0823_11950 [Francisella halioticida]